MTSSQQLMFVECISIEKRGFIPNRYTVYVLIVEWDNGLKYPIYRKYSSFFDFERMLRQKLGNVGIPELPQLNALEKAFRRQKNHVNDLNEFCQKIMAMPRDILNSHDVVAFFEIWHTDFPMEEPDDRTQKKEDKKKQNDEKVLKQIESSDLKALEERLADKITPSAPQEEFLSLPLPVQPRSRSTSATEDDLMKADVYVCIADYVPDSADELSMQEGWKCVVLEKNNDGWWFIMRERDGHQGYAPGSFLMAESAKTSSASASSSEMSSQLNNNNNIDPSHGGVKDAKPLKVRALSKYSARNGDEMTCREGQELEVLNMDSNGWWTVRSDGKVGLVPAVHLEPSSPKSARASEVFFRNNSLYSRNPPPRRQQVRANKSPAGQSDFFSLDQAVPLVEESPGYASIEEINCMMAGKRLAAPNRGKSEGLLDYAELVFDEKTEKPVFAKSTSHNALGVSKAAPKKQDTIIYTQIVPKHLRTVEAAVEEVSITGKKPERGNALKKQVVPKKEPVKPKAATRSPSPPTAEGRHSPLSIKPRSPRPQEPLHNYENHSLTAAAGGSNGESQQQHTYMNVNSLSNSCTSHQCSDNTEPKKRSMLAYRRDPPGDVFHLGVPSCINKPIPGHYLRRSSIEPPPAPTVEAPTPSHITDNGPSSIESYSPVMSRIQASASYDGPPISGMLMFTKGDTATLMSKTSDIGWWYVNLKGLEGYVPGGYWESYQVTSPAIAQPRSKAPQPVPRTRSPPNASNTEKNALEQEAWYHGKLSRPESEKLLSNFSNGIFLIRESVNRVGDLTLSVRWEGKARHFPIEAKEGGLFYIGKHDFKTLRAVISHYSKHPLFYSEKNEPVRLKEPAAKTSS